MYTGIVAGLELPSHESYYKASKIICKSTAISISMFVQHNSKMLVHAVTEVCLKMNSNSTGILIEVLKFVLYSVLQH